MASSISLGAAYFSLVPSLKGTADVVKAGLGPVEKAASQTAKKIGSDVEKSLSPTRRLLKDIGFGFSNAGDGVKSFTGWTQKLGAVAGKPFAPMLTGLKNLAAGWKDPQAAASSFTGFLGAAGGKMRSAFETVWAKIPGGAKTAFSEIGRIGQSGIGKLGSLLGPPAMKAGSVIANGIGSAAQKAGNFLETLGKVGLTALTALGGATIAGGFQRAVNIDNAKATLAGLKMDASTIDQVMSDAAEAVNGTAFSMGEAAKVAASATAAGVKPGKELERVLRLTADAAATAQVDMSDMGTIFNKVAATGKLNGEVVAQLGERGIPVLTKLAEHYGVTAEEAQKMVSEGKVSFQEFTTVMENTLGGAADELGNKTFSGALKNMLASFSRAGEKVVAPLMEPLREGFIVIRQMVDAAGPTLTVFGEKLGSAFSGALPKLQNIAAAAESFFASLGDGGTSLGPLGVVFTTLGEAARVLGPALKDVGILLGQTLASAVQALAPVLPPLFETLLSVISALAPAVTTFVQALAPVLEAVLPLIADLLATIVPILSEVVAAILPALLPLVQVLTPILQIIGQVLVAILPVLAPLIELLGALLVPVLQLLAPLFELLAVVLMPIVDILGAVLIPIVETLSAVWTVVIDILRGVVEAMTGTGEGANILGDIFQSIGDVIASVWNWLGDVIGGIGSGIRAVFDGIASAVQWVGGIFENVGNFIADVWNGVLDSVKGAINWIIGGINTFIRGINSVKIPDWVPGVGGLSFNIPTIPKLAEGATVKPQPGGTLALLAEAGKAETVVDEGLQNRMLANVIALIEDIDGAEPGDGGGDVFNISGFDLADVLAEADRRRRRKQRRRALVV